MAAGFFMALAVPDAFQDEAAWFAVAYFVVRILNSALYVWGVRDDAGQLRAVARLSPWFLVAACVALAGGFVDADYRAWVWLGVAGHRRRRERSPSRGWSGTSRPRTSPSASH